MSPAAHRLLVQPMTDTEFYLVMAPAVVVGAVALVLCVLFLYW